MWLPPTGFHRSDSGQRHTSYIRTSRSPTGSSCRPDLKRHAYSQSNESLGKIVGHKARLIQRRQRTARSLSEFNVEGIVWSQPMIPADELNRSGDLLQCCVVEGRAQDFEGIEECACLFRRDSPLRSPASSVLRTSTARNAGTSACSPAWSRSSTPIDESVCSSGKHQDNVTEASTTIRFKNAPRGAARGSSYRRAKDHGLCQSL